MKNHQLHIAIECVCFVLLSTFHAQHSVSKEPSELKNKEKNGSSYEFYSNKCEIVSGMRVNCVSNSISNKKLINFKWFRWILIACIPWSVRFFFSSVTQQAKSTRKTINWYKKANIGSTDMAAGRKQNFLFDTFFSPNFFLILSIFRSDFGTHTAWLSHSSEPNQPKMCVHKIGNVCF